MKVLGGSDVLPSPLAGEGLGERGRPCPRRGQQSRLTALAMCFRKDSTNSCATMAPSPPTPPPRGGSNCVPGQAFLGTF